MEHGIQYMLHKPRTWIAFSAETKALNNKLCATLLVDSSFATHENFPWKIEKDQASEITKHFCFVA